MEDKENICPECSEVNESEYYFCKNCGAPLKPLPENGKEKKKRRREKAADIPPAADTAAEDFADPDWKYGDGYEEDKGRSGEPSSAENTAENGGRENADSGEKDGNSYTATPSFTYTPYGSVIDSIDGIPTEDISAFIGKKAGKYVKKFSDMQVSGSKVSWNWAAAALSFFLGPLGAAIWFCYRKMYKWGIIAAAVALVLFSAVMVSYNAGLPGNNARESGILAEDDTIIPAESDGFVLYDTTNSLYSFASTAVTILTGLFATKLYKKFVIKSIKRYMASNPDPRYYKIGLSIAGGTSGGAVVLLILAAAFAAPVITYLTRIV